MAGHTYEESKNIALRTIVILAIITVVEVFIALAGKGYLISGFIPYESQISNFPIGRAIMYLLMISMSLYKAYLVIFEFMHLKYEVKALMRSVLLPTTLLIWAIIAFFMEGKYWHDYRKAINDRDAEHIESKMVPLGESIKPADTGGH